MSKRRQLSPDLDEENSEINLQDLNANIQAKGGEHLTGAAFINFVRDELSTLETKRRTSLVRPFSHVLWKDIAPRFGLKADGTWAQFDHFVVPKASLPPSFHRKLMSESSQWLDVYQERNAQEQEAARVRLMDAVCTRDICQRWRGSTFSSSGTFPFVRFSRDASLTDRK
jgi:hypothetical protein